MYGVYKIENQINHKVYIGSTIRGWIRWQQHKNTAFNPNSKHYNYHLYNAIRKYGLENFIFSFIKTDFFSIEEMQDYEQQMIFKYDSYNNGYNQTIYTKNALSDPQFKKKGTSCALVDKNEKILECYESYHEAARKNNLVGLETHLRLVCKGLNSSIHNLLFRDLDENQQVISKPLLPYKGKKPLIGINVDTEEERYFESISAAARELNSDRTSIEQCIQGSSRYSIIKGYILREIDLQGNIIENNIDIETRLKKYNDTNPLINGERHTLKEWLKIYNISGSSFYKRKKKGMNTIEALTAPKRR